MIRYGREYPRHLRVIVTATEARLPVDELNQREAMNAAMITPSASRALFRVYQVARVEWGDEHRS